MGIPKDRLQNLANTLEGDKDLNSPRELSAEAEKELAIVEKTIREAHVDHVNPELKCILVILPSRHSPTGILMQREDVILEWIFLPCKPNKKLKTYIEKISDLIHKGWGKAAAVGLYFIFPGICTLSLYSIVYMYHIFLIHSSVEGHLGCFQILAITNNAAMNIVEHVSMWYDYAVFGYMPKSALLICE
ncbi:hypothetical protein STEG23_027897 [Scotinomys teguina]